MVILPCNTNNKHYHYLKFKMILIITMFKFSLISLACLSPYTAFATEQADLEHITVYEKQNRVILNSGLATKSDMSLMETPAPIVVVDLALINSQGVDNLQDLARNIRAQHKQVTIMVLAII